VKSYSTWVIENRFVSLLAALTTGIMSFDLFLRDPLVHLIHLFGLFHERVGHCLHLHVGWLHHEVTVWWLLARGEHLKVLRRDMLDLAHDSVGLHLPLVLHCASRHLLVNGHALHHLRVRVHLELAHHLVHRVLLNVIEANVRLRSHQPTAHGSLGCVREFLLLLEVLGFLSELTPSWLQHVVEGARESTRGTLLRVAADTLRPLLDSIRKTFD